MHGLPMRKELFMRYSSLLAEEYGNLDGILKVRRRGITKSRKVELMLN